MNLSLALLLAAVPSAAAAQKGSEGKSLGVRGDRKLPAKKKGKKKGKYPAPHEVHQYEQVKFNDEPEWDCKDADVAGLIGCIQCWNPREVGGDALVVQVKAMYKRENFNIRDETLDPPRDHCIFPNGASFWTCFNSNLVIEPDTAWLDSTITLDDGTVIGPFNDKKQWDADGNKETDGSGGCLPGSIAAQIFPGDSVFI